MQGTIAQIIALTTHGNAFLNGADVSLESNDTLQFCEFVRFVDLRRTNDDWEESDFAKDPSDWLSRLNQQGSTAIRMIYGPSETAASGDKKPPDRMMVGFVGGGGRWLMETIGPRSSDFWEGRWEVGDQNRSDQKIWRVTYGRVASNHVGKEKIGGQTTRTPIFHFS